MFPFKTNLTLPNIFIIIIRGTCSHERTTVPVGPPTQPLCSADKDTVKTEYIPRRGSTRVYNMDESLLIMSRTKLIHPKALFSLFYIFYEISLSLLEKNPDTNPIPSLPVSFRSPTTLLPLPDLERVVGR